MNIKNNKILDGLTTIAIEHPFYYEFLMLTKFIEKYVPTMGIRTTFGGFEIFYNNKFINSINEKETKTILIHEVFHVLFDHEGRTKYRDIELSNKIQDMIINTIIKEHIPNTSFPMYKNNLTGEMCVDGYFIPSDYKDEHVFEILYDWILKKKEERKQDKKNGDDKNNSSKNSNELNDLLDSLIHEDETGEKIIKTLDEHLKNECSDSYKKEIVKNIINAAKARGHFGSDIQQILNKLQRPKKNYLKEIKKGTEYVLGKNKKKTFKRFNRFELFGLKGKMKKGSFVNVILDVSGSMNGYFEYVLNHIFYNDMVINLIQNDTEIKSVDVIKSTSELQKIKIKGLGGTVLQPAVDLIKEKYNKFNTIILTDGETDSLNFSGYNKKILILSTNIKCNVSGSNNIKQIIIEKN